ncbi:MAG: metalloregulator ArsR/SmtB family transcription factor [Bacteroidota bacterium]
MSTDLVPATHLEATAAKFRLLGDPVRLQILNTLMVHPESTVQELAQATGQSHQNTSKHLRALADGRMVGRRREGTFAHYRIIDPTVQSLCLLVCGHLQRLDAEASP